LAALYGSEVIIQTEIGKGSTFSFELLLKTAEQKVVAKEKINLQLNELNVLLAEDNKINMLVATKLLSRWGIQADCAVNGNDALEKAAQKKYDIILMDIHMPEKNGYDATMDIRQEESINKDARIYALTADITANMQLEYGKYFNGFLRKPIEVEKLYDVLSIDV
jgi:CheY-like chemotaxis protein